MAQVSDLPLWLRAYLRMYRCRVDPVSYPLGYPLGAPNDVELQRRIVRALLTLTARDDVPLLTPFEPEAPPIPAA